MPKHSRTARRRAAAIQGAKILLTSASLVATIGGWAAISAGDSLTEEVAQMMTATDQPTTTPVVPTATAMPVVPTATTSTSGTVTDASIAAPTATTAPTSTDVPMVQPTAQPTATEQPRIRTQSSR